VGVGEIFTRGFQAASWPGQAGSAQSVLSLEGELAEWGAGSPQAPAQPPAELALGCGQHLPARAGDLRRSQTPGLDRAGFTCLGGLAPPPFLFSLPGQVGTGPLFQSPLVSGKMMKNPFR